MGELSDPDDRCWNHQLKPGPGFHFVYDVKRRVGEKRFDAYCEQLGIKIDFFVRNDAAVKNRRYTTRYRWLTDEEVGRILELHYASKARGDWW